MELHKNNFPLNLNYDEKKNIVTRFELLDN